MNNKPFAIRDIYQIDNYTFTIIWNDGLQQHYRLSDLQKQCPCAQCIDERTGMRRVDAKTIPDNVRARLIRSVGRYALQIHFTSGCSTGIYNFDQLRQIGASV